MVQTGAKQNGEQAHTWVVRRKHECSMVACKMEHALKIFEIQPPIIVG